MYKNVIDWITAILFIHGNFKHIFQFPVNIYGIVFSFLLLPFLGIMNFAFNLSLVQIKKHANFLDNISIFEFIYIHVNLLFVILFSISATSFKWMMIFKNSVTIAFFSRDLRTSANYSEKLIYDDNSTNFDVCLTNNKRKR